MSGQAEQLQQTMGFFKLENSMRTSSSAHGSRSGSTRSPRTKQNNAAQPRKLVFPLDAAPDETHFAKF
jgi:hypothetical protein